MEIAFFGDTILPRCKEISPWPVVCSVQRFEQIDKGYEMAHLSSEPPVSTIRPAFTDRHRRGSRRTAFNAAVEVMLPEVGSGVAINVSDGGLRVAVDCNLHAGDECMIRVDAPGRPERERARVVWSQQLPDGCIAGLEIVGLN